MSAFHFPCAQEIQIQRRQTQKGQTERKGRPGRGRDFARSSRYCHLTFSVFDIQRILILEHDPLDLDILIQQLADSVAHFKKSAYAIKAGQSDPALIRALQVELPDELGGKMNFSDLANVGPKPGEARSLVITVFDAQVLTVHYLR
jgi:hypothetical protein